MLCEQIILDNNGRKSYLESMKSCISEKGQVTIPKQLRRKLGLKPGTVVEFDTEGGRLIGIKSVDGDPVGKWRGRGHLPGGIRVDDYLDSVRGGHADSR